jgi:hypothetical protein
MSDDTSINPVADFLLGIRDQVVAGTSIYGPVGSPKQVEKLAELDAKLALGRQLGEIPPAPEPWSVERAARERLAQEHPLGDLSAQPVSEMLTEHIRDKAEAIKKLSDRAQADVAQQVADDLAYRASDVSVRHSVYRREGRMPTGAEIVNQLVEDARPALAFLGLDEKTVRLDRNLLELAAVRGRNMTSYANRKRELGLSS